MKKIIRNSAKALIVKDNKVLLIKLLDEDGYFYIMPGGGQEVEESLFDTLIREIKEEVGMLIKPIDLAFVIEGIKGEKYHRVDLVFQCEYIDRVNNIELSEDERQVGYEWIPLNNIDDTPLYPKKLRKAIYEFCCEGNVVNVYLGNENKGE